MKRKSIKLRIIASGMAITAVAVVIGLLGHVMFSRVGVNTARLNGRSLASVQHAAGVERSAFECLLEEHNYRLEKKEQIHQRAKQKVAELVGSLDQAGVLRV